MYVYIIRKSDILGYQHAVLPPHYKDAPVRDESRMGYKLLARILEKHYNHTNLVEKIVVTNEGKPRLLDDSLYFNISHSTDFIACVVGAVEVGIDIEQIRVVSDALARHILHKNEVNSFNESELLKVWVQKEAYSKYIGKGLAIGFSTIMIEDILKIPHLILNNSEYEFALFYQSPETAVTVSYVVP